MIYAIGDIHGSYIELFELHKRIMYHASLIPEEHTIVCLGDYIDRGDNSKKVIDFLTKKPFTGFKHIYLMGNHEEMARDTYKMPSDGRWGPLVRTWIDNGGETTLRDYGLTHNDLSDDTKDPEDMIEFFSGLQRYWRKGKFFFVHAGVQPLRKLSNQSSVDFLWIRQKFLEYTGDWEDVFGTTKMTVVHGHTPISYDPHKGNERSNEPLILGNRINLDTGCVWSGKLGCVMIDNGGNSIKGVI